MLSFEQGRSALGEPVGVRARCGPARWFRCAGMVGGRVGFHLLGDRYKKEQIPRVTG
jgi:hypothetical protein